MRRPFILCLIIILLAACQPEPDALTPTAVDVSEATPDNVLPPPLSTLPATPTRWPTATLAPGITPTYQPTPTLQPLLAEGGALPHGALDRIGIGLIQGTALSPDGTQIAFATTTGIYVYHTADFSLVWRRYLFDAPRSIDWSADGAHLVTSAPYPFGLAIIWDAASGERLVELDRTWPRASFSPDGSRIVVPAYPYQLDSETGESEEITNRLLLFDTQGQLIHILDSGTSGYYSVIFDQIVWSPDGQFVAALHTTEETEIFIWNVETGELHATLETTSRPFQNFIRFSPDSQYLATKLSDGQAVIWDITNDQIQLLIDQLPFLYDVLWTPDGEQIITLGEDSTLFRDAQTGDIRNRLSYQALTGTWSPDGGKLALQGNNDARIVDASGDELAVFPGGLYSHGYALVKVYWLPDNQHVVTVAGDDLNGYGSVVDIGLWEWESQTLLAGMHPALEPFEVAWTPDSQTLMVSVRQIPYFGDWQEFVYVWDALTHEVTREYKSDLDDADSVFEGQLDLNIPHPYPDVFPSPYGGLAVAYDTINVCEDRPEGDYCYDTLKYVIRQPNGSRIVLDDDIYHGDSIDGIAWSPDGLRLAIGTGLWYSADVHNVIRIIDPFTGEELFVLEGHSGRNRMIAFSPRADRIATVSEDSTVIIWDLTR